MKRLMWTMVFSAFALWSGEKPVPFAGKWILDASRSELGSGPASGRGVMAARRFTVSLDQETLTIKRFISTGFRGDFTLIEKVSLDGQETPNPSEWGKRTLSASWLPDQETLTITIQSTMNREGRDFPMKTTEVWRLTEGGKVLRIDQTRVTPRGERHNVLYYTREKDKE